MRNLIAGFVLGVVVTGGVVWAQQQWDGNSDIYGRPQFGKQITPPRDFYGRINFPSEESRRREPC